jgi:NitT/TauT family transport system substrate-binding protein
MAVNGMARTAPRNFVTLALGALFILGCTSGGTDASPSDTPSSAAPAASDAPSGAPGSAAPLGAPEQTDVTIGMWLPNAGSVAPLQVAVDRGYFADEGLNVEFLVVDDTRAAVVGGSVDIGILDIGPVAQAISEDLDIQIATAYRCRRTYVYAVRPEIETVDDLSGKDVVIEFVAGEPDGNARKAKLKEAGWDLDSVSPPPNYVIIPGFSNATTAAFVAGNLFGTPVYPQTREAVLEAGGQLVVDEESDWPNDVVFANTDWIAENPNTMARVIRGIMRGIADTLDKSQQADIVALVKEAGFAVENEEKTLAADPDGTALDQNQYCENMYFDQPLTDELLTTQGLDPLPEWERLADISSLLAAQESNGMSNELPPIPGD